MGSQWNQMDKSDVRDQRAKEVERKRVADEELAKREHKQPGLRPGTKLWPIFEDEDES